MPLSGQGGVQVHGLRSFFIELRTPRRFNFESNVVCLLPLSVAERWNVNCLRAITTLGALQAADITKSV
jgi:hypothetical protein